VATSLPEFNIMVSYWFAGGSPAAGPADGTCMAQLYFNSRNFADITPGDDLAWAPAVFLRIKKEDFWAIGTPFVTTVFGWTDDNGLTFYWIVRWWEYTHAGFPNMYISASLDQCSDSLASPDPTR